MPRGLQSISGEWEMDLEEPWLANGKLNPQNQATPALIIFITWKPAKDKQVRVSPYTQCLGKRLPIVNNIDK